MKDNDIIFPVGKAEREDKYGATNVYTLAQLKNVRKTDDFEKGIIFERWRCTVS